MTPEQRDKEHAGSRERSREAKVLRVRREGAALTAEPGEPRSRPYTVLGFVEPDAARSPPGPDLSPPEAVTTPPTAPAELSPTLSPSTASQPARPASAPAAPSVADAAMRGSSGEPRTVSLKLLAAHAARVGSRQRRAARQSRTQRAGTGAAIALVLAGGVTFSALSSIDEGSAFDITPAASAITQSFGFGTLEAQRAADKRDAGGSAARKRRRAERPARERAVSPAKSPAAQPATASPPRRQTPERNRAPARDERRTPARRPQAQAPPRPRPQPQQRPQPQPQQKATPKPAPIRPAKPPPSSGGDPALGSGPGL